MKKQLKHIAVNINDLKPAAYNPREELRPIAGGIKPRKEALSCGNKEVRENRNASLREQG